MAAAIDVQFPGAMADLKPHAGRPRRAGPQFVAGVPILAKRSPTAESAEFQTDFLEYIKDNEAPAPEVKLVTAAGAA